MITINYIIRKMYRSVIESVGGLGRIAQSRKAIFLFNRGLIPPRMHEKDKLSRDRELDKYLSNFS